MPLAAVSISMTPNDGCARKREEAIDARCCYSGLSGLLGPFYFSTVESGASRQWLRVRNRRSKGLPSAASAKPFS